MSPKVVRLRKGRAAAPPLETPTPEYYFEDGLRKVKPYRQTYLAHVKQRWIKRTVPEVFASEMPRRCTESMIMEAMKRGDVLVNDAIVSTDYVLKGGESLRSINCHRHEPPVPDTPIRVIEQTKDYIVFDKPHGITVHPNELNFFNTALEILRRDHDIPSYMHAINRLDAVTSGVVIFANVSDTAIRERFQPPNTDPDAESEAMVRKEYVCRVIGEFPENPIVVTEPILQSGGKVCVDPTGKPSKTRFERIWYDADSNTSLVRSTGRQHQIRLHAAYLKHPIVNDKLYNPAYRLNADLTANGETRFYPKEIPPESQPYMPYYITPDTPCHKCKEEQEGTSIPNPKEMKIWLRAIRYQGPDWNFEVDMPDWANSKILE
ncbi:RNA pseudouridylate synthase domain containing protein 2 [Haplosporangium sp. Z 767]|nr:RNA pseudouridylate synthase domain containing protein 2 [Haplosporangium sp. Z 11]KAF9192975.1 RNA pseudouridylate synthase domain containing protein 2 [Haplosporangium sp. Z 767]